MDYKILQELLTAIEEHQQVALATVIRVDGSSPARPGFQLLVYQDGRAIGNVGGGELEARIRNDAQVAIATGQSNYLPYELREEGDHAIGTLCGGQVTVFVEPYVPKPSLVIVGGGHIGQPLAELARIVGYDVNIVDARQDRGSSNSLEQTVITPHTSVVLITEDHHTDEQYLRIVLETPAMYVGMIGSRGKIRSILENMRKDGYTEKQLTRLHAPIGLNLGGRLPSEIALAILAEVEMIRHTGDPQSRGQLSRTVESPAQAHAQPEPVIRS